MPSATTVSPRRTKFWGWVISEILGKVQPYGQVNCQHGTVRSTFLGLWHAPTSPATDGAGRSATARWNRTCVPDNTLYTRNFATCPCQWPVPREGRDLCCLMFFSTGYWILVPTQPLKDLIFQYRDDLSGRAWGTKHPGGAILLGSG